jgi:hypothetical protein
VALAALFAYSAIREVTTPERMCNALHFLPSFTFQIQVDVTTTSRITYSLTFLCSFPMLDYVKMILTKVSFNKALFEKELRKALKMLLPAELPDFRTWCYQQFSRIYRRVLRRVFSEISPSVA